jgi:hypothetical protein
MSRDALPVALPDRSEPALHRWRSIANFRQCWDPLAGTAALLSGLSNVRYPTLCGLKPDIASGPKGARFGRRVLHHLVRNRERTRRQHETERFAVVASGSARAPALMPAYEEQSRYVNKLLKYGLAKARAGHLWRTTPPASLVRIGSSNQTSKSRVNSCRARNQSQ